MPAGTHAADLRSYERAKGKGPLDRCIGEGMKMRRDQAALAFRGSQRDPVAGTLSDKGAGWQGEGVRAGVGMGCVGLVRRGLRVSHYWGHAFSASCPLARCLSTEVSTEGTKDTSPPRLPA